MVMAAAYDITFKKRILKRGWLHYCLVVFFIYTPIENKIATL